MRHCERGTSEAISQMKVKSYKFKVASLLFTIGYSLFAIGSLHAQQKNLLLNREWGLEVEKNNGTAKTQLDTSSFKKMIRPSDGVIPFQSCFKPRLESESDYKRENTGSSKKYLIRKIKQESLFIVNDTADKFHMTIDPLFNFEFGRDVASRDTIPEKIYQNTRGVIVRGDIGKKFSFESSFYENQATFASYIDSFNEKYFVVPGQGRWKKFKNNGYDFAMASGYVSYSPSKHFNFQVGHGKHFVGDGYRSLLLSDNAFNYPYARITSTFGKFQYTNLYAVFMNLTDGGVKAPPGTEPIFQKKAGNFQFLSWNIQKRVQLGFFQGVIWQASDSMNNQHLSFSYFSPIIYNAALTEGLAGKNNVLLGWTLKIKITKSISVYGQYMLDDIGGYKNGVQAGFTYFDVFGIKNLHLQLEGNDVSSYSYSSALPAQSYSHYNQPLAHPLGANFIEGISFLNYHFKDFFTQLKINYAVTGWDHLGSNYGNNIFISDTNIPVDLPWGNRTLRIIDFRIGYLVNPTTNFNIVAGISNRNSVSPVENSQTNYLYFGIRTSLSNVYYDF